MKKLGCLLISGVMAATMLSAPVWADGGDVPTVKMMVMDLSGTGLPDVKLVEDKINEYLVPEANARLEMEVVPVASYEDTLTMRVASGESVDIAVIADGELASLSQQGMFLDMSDLIQEYGQDIISAFKDNGIDYLLESDYTGDALYYLTNIEGKGFSEFLVMNKDVLDELGVDVSTINTMEDMEPIYDQVKEKYPNMTCYVPWNTGEELVFLRGSGLNPWTGFEEYDPLSDSMGALMSFDSTELVNPYATEEYKNAVTKAREWYDKGYLAKDVATATDGASVTFQNQSAFSSLMLSEQTEEQFTEFMNQSSDFNVIAKAMTKPMVNTRRAGAVIPASSANPEAAMRVLNEFYSNGDVIDALYYGVEGTHYYINDDNAVVFTEADGTENGSSNSQYSASNVFLIGNLNAAHCRLGVGGQSAHDSIIPSLTESKVIPSLGFSFDYSSVSAEYAAVSAVLDQYYVGLGTGSMDPETTLDEFLQKLNDAGIDKVIAEKQAQYDAFLAAKN